MVVLNYGTDHERFSGLGIVLFDQLDEHPHPDPHYHLYPQTIKAKRAFVRRLKSGQCVPWSPECRLKAEASRETWSNI